VNSRRVQKVRNQKTRRQSDVEQRHDEQDECFNVCWNSAMPYKLVKLKKCERHFMRTLAWMAAFETA